MKLYLASLLWLGSRGREFGSIYQNYKCIHILNLLLGIYPADVFPHLRNDKVFLIVLLRIANDWE